VHPFCGNLTDTGSFLQPSWIFPCRPVCWKPPGWGAHWAWGSAAAPACMAQLRPEDARTMEGPPWAVEATVLTSPAPNSWLQTANPCGLRCVRQDGISSNPPVLLAPVKCPMTRKVPGKQDCMLGQPVQERTRSIMMQMTDIKHRVCNNLRSLQWKASASHMAEEPEQCQHPLGEGLSHLLLTLPLHSQQVLSPRPSHPAVSRSRRGLRFTAARAEEPEYHMGTAASNWPCPRSNAALQQRKAR